MYLQFYRLFFISIFLLAPLSALSLTLGEKLLDATSGDYIVISQQKHSTLFHILSKEKERLYIEEITIADSLLSQDHSQDFWQTWIDKKAPGNSSWILSLFSLPSYAHEWSYSYTTAQYLQLDERFHLLSSLFRLPMERVDFAQRKRVGLLPREGEVDKRAIWQPPIIVNNRLCKIPSALFSIEVPKGHGELSSKMVDLYFPLEPPALTYFPYWIEVRGTIGKVHSKVIDSGRGLNSPALEFVRFTEGAPISL